MSSVSSTVVSIEDQEIADEIASKQLSAILEIIGKLLSEQVLVPDLGELRPQVRDTLGTIDAAADSIMSEVEKLQTTDLSTPDAAECIKASCMNILEACSFHDLCSQRLTKIDKTIDRFTTGIEAVRDFVAGGSQPVDELPTGSTSHDISELDDPEAGLLNGPALDGEGIDQDEVDRLLDFD